MADYFTLLKRAVDGLESNTGMARRAVYERARTALVNQLKQIDPPLSPSDITKQRLELEEAIRKVEADAAQAVFQSAAKPAAPASAEAVTGDIADTDETDEARDAAPDTAPDVPAPEPVAADADKAAKVEEDETGTDGEPEAMRASPSSDDVDPVQPAPAIVTEPATEVTTGSPQTEEAHAPARPVEPASGEPEQKKVAKVDPAPDLAAGRHVLKEAVVEAEQLGGATRAMSATMREIEQETQEDVGREAEDGRAAVSSEQADSVDMPRQGGGFGRFLMWLIVVVLLGGAAGALYMNKDSLMSLVTAGFDTSEAGGKEGASGQATGGTGGAASGVATGPKKITERVTENGIVKGEEGGATKPVVNKTRVVTTQPIVAKPETTDVNGQPTAPAAQAAGDQTPKPQTPAGDTTTATKPQSVEKTTKPQAIVVGQRATLIEEGTIDPSKNEVTAGVVTWAFKPNPNDLESKTKVLIGTFNIADRGLSGALIIRDNEDETLPASHMVELTFKVSGKSSIEGISTIPGMLLKDTEQASGAVLIGKATRVTDHYFWIGLSNIETERTMNEDMLRTKGWIDVPVVFKNGKRGILTLEKGIPGMQAFQDALAAWGQ